MNNSKNWMIIVGIVVIIIAAALWLLPGSAASPTVSDGAMNDSDADDTSMQSDAMAGDNMEVSTAAQNETVAVNNQAAGTNVAIASMNLSRDTWVAVRDERSILGAGWFAAGTTSGSVELLRGTEAGKSYTVVLYIDNGNHAFEYKGDALVDGVQATFTATEAGE